jgi:BirA family transcriptional regulator, biotin operon repressor / biotin---[acetyl-CoA-carboxylase] ligase
MLQTDVDWRPADRPRRRVGRGLEVHERIGSTNDRARELLGRDDGEGRAVVAEEQTAGRGRLGRTWLSPAGRNLMVSVAFRPRIGAGDAWQLGLAAGLAARSACAHHAAVQLKWPNDLVTADGAKLGGILVETSLDGDQVTAAVIGTGINVNWRLADMPPDLAAGATSLADLAGADVDRVALLASLLDELDAEVTAVEAGHSPLERYRAACATLGHEVAVQTATGRVVGRAVDLDEHGALVVETEDGRVSLTGGDVLRVGREASA